MQIRSLGLSIALVFGCHSVTAKPAGESLAQLFHAKQYFELRDLLGNTQVETTETLFFKAVVANRFNQPKRSISLINQYLRRVKREKGPAWRVASYEILADNYLKTHQYRKAANTYRTIIASRDLELTERQKSGYENSFRLWNALREVPPQTTNFRGDSILRASMKAVPLEINRQKISLGIDSGADLSIITRSLAGALRLKIIRASIKVGSISGLDVAADLGIAREVKLGNVIVSNVVFLVFEDKDLLGPTDGELRGILGFPLISALREITFNRAGEITIPERPRQQGEPNLCLEGLKPLIAGMFKGKRLTFTFDTGARRSTLYPPFFRAYEAEITSHYDLTKEKITGVGGSKDIAAYRLKDLTIVFSGKDARFAEISLLTEFTLDNSHYFYGNIGQDLISKFENMTLSFASMKVNFE